MWYLAIGLMIGAVIGYFTCALMVIGREEPQWKHDEHINRNDP